MVGQPISSTVSLVWSAITDQSPIGMAIFSTIAVISIITVLVYGFLIFISGVASFNNPGYLLLVALFALVQCGAWPYGIMGPYLLTFLYKFNAGKYELFKSYGRNTKCVGHYLLLLVGLYLFLTYGIGII